jgi:hypothetical protein
VLCHASLKKLYDVLHDGGFYPYPNPMVHEDAAKTIAAFRQDRREAIRNAIGRAPMPAVSGIDEPPTDLRLSQNYFRLVNQEWTPHSIDDPDFPRLVIAAGPDRLGSARNLRCPGAVRVGSPHFRSLRPYCRRLVRKPIPAFLPCTGELTSENAAGFGAFEEALSSGLFRSLQPLHFMSLRSSAGRSIV